MTDTIRLEIDNIAYEINDHFAHSIDINRSDVDFESFQSISDWCEENFGEDAIPTETWSAPYPRICILHIGRRWTWIESTFYFASAKDMLVFKMRWSG